MANEKFQKALQFQSQNCPPIWMMRQAGRYHSHYQNLRKKYSFMQLCKEAELAAEVAWGPIEEFDFDVAILFSDLLFPLEALGMGLSYSDAKGPELGWHLNASTLRQLKAWEEALPALQFQAHAMRATREKIPQNKSLIGFVGGYWTLFTYAVQGRHDGHLLESKKNLSLFEPFVSHLRPLLEANIKLQLENGAELVMLFDTAAGELSPTLFNVFVEPTVRALAERFPGKLGYYSKGTQKEYLSNLQNEKNLAGLGIDHRWSLPQFLKSRPQTSRQFTQGNFDQGLLHLDPRDFKNEVHRYLAPLKELSPEERRGWVCGLGHGVLPKTPEKNVKAFVEFVRESFS